MADSGLMTKKNVQLLQTGKYKYILGARIRNEAKEIREWILSQEKEENTYPEYEKTHILMIYVSKTLVRAFSLMSFC
ncbi:hypothetical protein [Xylanibacter brevis]|uniref:hypothetical protein n=1 Tax=Xylanibacter brevis TaxID=83231 RepID=UPI0012DC7A2A|nr:hypothetical protein [Xylanibacter brevis]